MTDPNPLREDEVVAKRLTKAQRLYLTTYAKWRSPAPGHEPRWMTYPPSNTLKVLCRLGLTDMVGQLRPLGVDARAAILRLDQVREGRGK